MRPTPIEAAARVLVRHLVAVRGPWVLVFPWPHCESTWYREFRRIVGVAGDAWLSTV